MKAGSNVPQVFVCLCVIVSVTVCFPRLVHCTRAVGRSAAVRQPQQRQADSHRNYQVLTILIAAAASARSVATTTSFSSRSTCNSCRAALVTGTPPHTARTAPPPPPSPLAHGTPAAAAPCGKFRRTSRLGFAVRLAVAAVPRCAQRRHNRHSSPNAGLCTVVHQHGFVSHVSARGLGVKPGQVHTKQPFKGQVHVAAHTRRHRLAACVGDAVVACSHQTAAEDTPQTLNQRKYKRRRQRMRPDTPHPRDAAP